MSKIRTMRLKKLLYTKVCYYNIPFSQKLALACFMLTHRTFCITGGWRDIGSDIVKRVLKNYKRR